MKKVLFVLLICLFMIPSVNAAEIDSCYNNYLINITWGNYYSRYDVNSDSWQITSYSNEGYVESLQYLFPAKPNTTYYIKFFTGKTFSSSTNYFSYFYFYDSDKKYLSSSSSLYGSTLNDQFYFTTPSNPDFSYVSFDLPQVNRTILGTTIAFADFNLSTCPIVEEPEPEPIMPDSTLDSFYLVYTSKLKEFTDYALENKYILGVLGIILLFIVLEIILNLFRKGGYR